jgi:hypothetical protein
LIVSDEGRIEQGVKNGFSGNHLRRSLNRGPQYRLLAHTSLPDYRVVGDEVHAAYDVGRAEIHHIRVRFTPFIQR